MMFNELYSKIVDKVDDNNQFVMLTFLESNDYTNGSIKEKILMNKDDINNKTIPLNSKIYDGINNALSIGQIQILNTDDDKIVIIEPFFTKPRLIVFGGGHISKPLCEFASRVGFSVTVIDDRPYFANSLRFPEAEKVICEDFKKSFEQITFNENDFVVIVTRGHKHDGLVLRNVVNNNLKYLGMIGSKRRVKGMMEELISEGFSKEALDKVHSPIGLDIDAITPDEIAISIVSQLISFKNKNIINNKERKHYNGEFDEDVISKVNSNDNTLKALLTILSSKGSVPRKAGAKMIAYVDGRTIGSIGGGCSEAEVLNTARSMILNNDVNKYSIEHVDMTGEVAESIGMVCGGTMEVLIEVF